MIKRILVVVGIFVVAGLIAWRLSNNKEKMKENAALTAEKIAVYSVEVDTAHTLTFNGDFEGLGSFEPSKEMNFLSEVAGKVLTLSLKEGDRVREGQTVATLDNEMMQNDLSGANTALTKAQNDVAKLDAVVRGGGATGQQLVDARFGIEQAQNKIAGLNIYLRKSEVKAPMSGIVFKKLIEKGSILGPGSPIAVLVDIDKLKFVANVDEAQVITIKQGQSVRVHAEVYPNKDFIGTVKLIGVRANDAKQFPIEIEVANNTATPIRGGMSGRAFFKRPNVKSALVVQRAAIIGSLQDAKVWVLDANNTAHLKSIQVGEVRDKYIEVRGGIGNGERVVHSGQFNLQEGIKTTVN